MKNFLAGYILLLLVSTAASAQQNTLACACCSEKFRQFDFWVGDWETFVGAKKDTLTGTNHIVLMENKCVIQENWKSARGAYTGTSYNFYNPQTDKWHQTWVDNQGGSLLLSGNLEDGKMVLWSDPMKTRNGQTYRNRITWTPNPDGSVRQHWEVTYDDGKSWTTLFDGLYRRKP